MILSDRWIREQAQTHGMIEPFVESQRRSSSTRSCEIVPSISEMSHNPRVLHQTALQ